MPEAKTDRQTVIPGELLEVGIITVMAGEHVIVCMPISNNYLGTDEVT